MSRPAAPGAVSAYDYEYERNGVSSLFMLFAPLDGSRRVEVREPRTKVDWAQVVKRLVDEDYADRDRFVLVMDTPIGLLSRSRRTSFVGLLTSASCPYTLKHRAPQES